MDERIVKFISSQKCITICTAENNKPYCANCFYAFIPEENILVFKSDRNTKHISQALANNYVAGTILADVETTGTLRGIQFTAAFNIPSDNLVEKSKKAYYNRFPFALAVPGDLWTVELVTVKLTDNILGFGKKLNWQKRNL